MKKILFLFMLLPLIIFMNVGGCGDRGPAGQDGMDGQDGMNADPYVIQIIQLALGDTPCEETGGVIFRTGFDTNGDTIPDTDIVDFTWCFPPGVAGPPGPGGGELICDDGIDNDEDGRIDCADPDCNLEYVFVPLEARSITIFDSVCTFPGERICNDEFDNDNDGFVDCADSDCDGEPIGHKHHGQPHIVNEENGAYCEFGEETSCDDGEDNDGDELTDCLDPDCDLEEICLLKKVTLCHNGVTIEVAKSAEQTHLDHGDELGECIEE